MYGGGRLSFVGVGLYFIFVHGLGWGRLSNVGCVLLLINTPTYSSLMYSKEGSISLACSCFNILIN